MPVLKTVAERNMPPITIDNLTPYGMYFYTKIPTGIEYQGQRYVLRRDSSVDPMDCFQHVSHWLLNEQNKTLASSMGGRDAEFDSVFSACATNVGSDQKMAHSLIKLGAEMGRLSNTERAPVFATAFCIRDPRRIRKVLDALGKNMDPASFGPAMTDGFGLLAEPDKVRAAGMLGREMGRLSRTELARVFATAFGISNLKQMDTVLDALGRNMDPANFGLAMIDGFRLLAETDKVRVAGMPSGRLFSAALDIDDPVDRLEALKTLKEHIDPMYYTFAMQGLEMGRLSRTARAPLFAAAFGISNLERIDIVLDALGLSMDPASFGHALTDGFRLLAETDKARVAGTLGATLFSAALSIDDPADRQEALEALKISADPKDYPYDMLDGFHLLPDGQKDRVAGPLGAPLFAAAFSIDRERMDEQLDVLSAYFAPAECNKAMLDGFQLLSESDRDRTRDVLHERLRAGTEVQTD